MNLLKNNIILSDLFELKDQNYNYKEAVFFSIAMVIFAFVAGLQITRHHYLIGGFYIFVSLLDLLLVLAYIWVK